ncbi:MAG: 2-hydroxychromene-2-carboxylate isomerase [Burkholderiaceae bacterium]
MKHIDLYLDFISPYAYLAFEHMPQALEGLSYSVAHKPVLFAGMLQHHGQLGPAEIAPKRDWTYRHVAWLAHSHGIPLDLPAAHPFNPIALLRLAIACSADGEPNRYVCETIFRHVWRGGHDAAGVVRLAELTAQLQPLREPGSAEVKAGLKANTDAAIALGLFGVPAFAVDGRIFWGLDSLPMLRAYMKGDAWFEGPAWEAPRHLPVGITRQK